MCNKVHKCIINKSSVGLNDMFEHVSDAHDVNTWASANNDLHIPLCRLKKSWGNLRYRGAVLYNEIPAPVKLAPSLNAFKSRMKAHNLSVVNKTPAS